MRTEIALVALVFGLVACAASPGPRPVGGASVVDASCADAAPAEREACGLPADVQVFIADRARCDHFRSEPWPEGDSPADRERRRALVETVRRDCAGMDPRLEALKAYHADRPDILRVLARFEPLDP